ncbi:MAG: hypothetical protein NVV57_11700 [Demequina sp.]|nr:hypothetical protein [Demequina sp.]
MSKRSRRHRDLARQLLATGLPVRRKDAESAFSAHAVKKCMRNGSLQRLLPQVVVHRNFAHDSEARLRAAALWIDTAGGALTGVAALWVWGVVEDAPRVTMVMLRNPLHRSTPRWLRPYRPRNGPAPMRVRGIPVVPLAHAVVHAWNETRGDTAVGLVVRAIGRKHVSSADVAAAVAATGRVRRKQDLLELLQVLIGGVTSFLEHRAKTVVFPEAQYPELRWNEPVTACDKDRVMDIYDPHARLDIELDSATFHGEVKDRVADIERDAELSTEGIATLRLDFFAVFERAAWCRNMYERVRDARLRDLKSDEPPTDG